MELKDRIRMRKLELNQYIFMFILLVLIGALINNFVITVNGGRMPVLTNNYIDSPMYFNYQDDFQINQPSFSDKYVLSFPSFDYRYSVGDVLAGVGIAGLVWMFFYCLYFKFVIIRRWKKQEIG